jgi:hypothetical protein
MKAMRQLGGVAALTLVVTAAPAGPAKNRWVDVDAVVSYETRQVLASGITRVESWQERLVRRGDQVWTERVRPPGAERAHDDERVAEHHGHKHLNADTAARWLSLGADGEAVLKLVDREHQVVVDVPAAEFASVAFDGRYDAAATIVPPLVVQSMKAEGSATAEGQWRSERNQGWTHRVLWSPTLQVAMKVESRRDDGSVQRTVTVRLLPTADGQRLPWQSLGGYNARRYDEYMD